MILLFDNAQKFISEIAREDVLEAEVEEKLGGLIQATISIPFDAVPDETSYFGYIENANLSLFKITKKEVEEKATVIHGIHAFFDDLSGHVIRDKRPTEQGAQFMLDSILVDTGWSAMANVSGNRSTTFYHKTALECFYEIVKLFQVEFKPIIHMVQNEITERIVIVEKHISKDYGKWFEYGDMLLKVKAEEDHASIATAFIGYGKGVETENGGYGRKLNFSDVEWSKAKGDPLDKPLGQDYLEFPDATKTYGYLNSAPRTAIVEFSNIEDANELLQSTYETGLQNIRPKVQLQASAISEERVELGEICAIVRPDLDIRYKTTVFHVKTDLLTGVQDFEFGDNLIVSQAEQIKALSNAIDEKQDAYDLGLDTFIEKIQAGLTDQWRNDDGYNYELKADNPYGLPAGYYSFNQSIDNNPSQVVGISAGKLVISNKKTPDGEWEFHTFGTGDGFTADLIQAGVLRGGDVEFNLETGTLKVGDSLYYSPEEGLILSASTREKLKGDKGDPGEPGAPGLDGMDGADGMPGADGQDGISSYIHIAWASDAFGLNFSTSDSKGRNFIGIYTDHTQADSTDYRKYEWSKYVGADGKDGAPGKNGTNGKDGASIATVSIEYAVQSEEGTSTTAPTSGWTTTPPQGSTATVWRRFLVRDTAGFSHYSEPEKLTTEQIQSAVEASKSDLLEQVMNAGFASQAYADGVVSDAEEAIIQRYENRMAQEIANLNADFEQKLYSMTSEIETRLDDQESYLWVDGGNLYLGRKGGDVALVISPEEMSFRVKNMKTGTFNSERLIVQNTDTQALRVVNPSGVAIFQWVTRQMSDGYHMSLEYVGP